LIKTYIMADQEPKKRGRKKGSKVVKAQKTGRMPKNLEFLNFEQLQALSAKVSELIKAKKEEQIKVLKEKLSELEKL
ncbi:MAG TPA: hypothetical protein VK155_11820, partial [Bacteroidales bacterium]|nr:hypothetical protein [Bacteroidales bacterium]